MSATEIVRRMLDERGVEWWPLGSNMTECVIDGIRYKFRQVGRGLIVSTCTEGTVTPEQAIAAALGSFNCTNSERTGTCHDKGTFNSWGYFTCSNCSIVIPLDAVKDAPSIGRTLPPKFCPNCGAKVVDPTTNDVDAEVDE